MSRCSSVFLALLLLTSGAALAKDKPAPKPGASVDMPADLQLIGWSKDETRFAVRNYDLVDSTNDLEEPPPYCPGYVNHLGKKFRGGLALQLYEGSKQTKSWNIQQSSPCTPPDKALAQLNEAKAALAQLDIDTAASSTVVMPRKGGKSSSRRKGKTQYLSSTTLLVLPSGPFARQTIEVSYRGEERDTSTIEDDPSAPIRASATFTVSLRSGKKHLKLAEFPLGPEEYYPMGAGHWTPTVDRLVLSPSGKRFVLLGHMSEGNMRDGSDSTFIFGLVELPEPPESASATSAPAR